MMQDLLFLTISCMFGKVKLPSTSKLNIGRSSISIYFPSFDSNTYFSRSCKTQYPCASRPRHAHVHKNHPNWTQISLYTILTDIVLYISEELSEAKKLARTQRNVMRMKLIPGGEIVAATNNQDQEPQDITPVPQDVEVGTCITSLEPGVLVGWHLNLVGTSKGDVPPEPQNLYTYF